jgi:hypothetical protein
LVSSLTFSADWSADTGKRVRDPPRRGLAVGNPVMGVASLAPANFSGKPKKKD